MEEQQEFTNTIGKDFSTFELFKFALPAFFTNVFSQIFKSLDDALFISRFVGPKALAGLNLLSPIMSIQVALQNLCSLGAANFTTSRLFVSVGNAKTSTIISIFRNLVFRSISLLVLPYMFGVNGVWFAIPTGEFIAFLMVVLIIYLNRDNYGYGKSGVAYYINN